MSGKKIVVVGASGLVGREVIRQCISSSAYKKVVALVRSPIDLRHDKLVQHDYDFDAPISDYINGEDLICCLGTTMKNAGSKTAFRRVDYDYVLETALIAKNNGIKNIAVVSAMGASYKSKVFYNRVKGEVEQDIRRLGFELCFICRPSLLLGKRQPTRLGEEIMKIVGAPFFWLLPKRYQPISSKKVASILLEYLNKGLHGTYIYEYPSLINESNK